MQTDVLIIGAGPTGLALAAQLIRYELDFIIVDPKMGVTELSKAIAVHARTLEIYDQIDLADRALDAGAIVNGVAMLHEGRILAELDFGNIGENLSDFPFVLTLEQSKNEHLLEDFLKASNRTVWWQTELEELSQNEQEVRAVVKSAAGERQEITAKYLVGCDGAGSKTRHLLEIPFVGDTDARLFYVADVEMDSEFDHQTLHAVFGADAFVLFFPLEGDGHWRIIGNLPDFKTEKDAASEYEEIEDRVKSLAKVPLDITEVRWFSTYKVHTRRAAQFSDGKAFLAGDAAHIHTPAGGQGMNTGIQDAYNLAWKIAYVLRQNADHALLDTYAEERVANAERLLRTTDEAFEFGTGEEWYFRFFRERILPNVAALALKIPAAKRFVFPLISQIGINYRQSSLSRPNHSESFNFKAGDRFPYFTIGEESIYEWLADAKSHLLIFDDGSGDAEAFAEAVSQLNFDFIEIKTIPLYPSLVELFNTAETFAVFTRPDGHIGFITSDNPLETLRIYLRENFKIAFDDSI